MRYIKVLVIDDSALVRQTLSNIINSDPQLEVIGTAADPYFAARKIRNEVPDVITLDLEMPRMNGLTFLKAMMAQYPIPVVIISNLTQKGSRQALKALELGAVEILAKSEIRNTKDHLEESQVLITDAIKAANMAPVRRRPLTQNEKAPETIAHPPSSTIHHFSAQPIHKIIAVGASTGGTEAIRELLQNASTDSPPYLIVQHMPAGFTQSFAKSLDARCPIIVREAVDGEIIQIGHAYICPGGFHMTLEYNFTNYRIRIKNGKLVNRHRPSVDVLFESIAQSAGLNAIGIILTGMGNDGATGLLQMRKHGAITIAQNQSTCVVYGMPGEAVKLGAAQYILPLGDIPNKLKSFH
ncbi:chemotaxis response regulator protein-glutamate methylesterase [Fulvivirga sp. 29W222]|uniref:Protein-glutamate methylesterase/protein-glutamine glutaminase n=1 Tax=Fulvivirga marina TaxID=2494733 RepID=A0A937G3D2_9BACT|nr:chemotaxis response regulator protein-glutamate methylesterase [Fulvivirga marina]MBL6449288.1 chemotaxis response regulator protein-glutamate methylesterase [Fulvivirga marina]